MGVPPRLIDLSVARTFERAAWLHGSIGTDAYMAPEQCDPGARARTIGPPADVLGLGATRVHAVTGERPVPPREGRARRRGPVERWPQLDAEPRAAARLRAPGRFAEPLDETQRHEPGERPTARELDGPALEPLVADLPRKLSYEPAGAATLKIPCKNRDSRPGQGFQVGGSGRKLRETGTATERNRSR